MVLAFVVFAAFLCFPLQAIGQWAPQRHWDVFRPPYGPDSNNIFVITPENEGLWFGTDVGLNFFNGRWASYPFTQILGRAPLNDEAGAQRHITAIAAAATGGIWAATNRGELIRWDKLRWRPAVEIGGEITDLHDTGSDLWIATKHGLMRSTNLKVTAVDELAAIPIYDLYYGEGYLWVGAETGLWRISPATGEVLRISTSEVLDPLDDAAITAIWGDSMGNLWLGLGLNLIELNLATGRVKSLSPFVARSSEFWITSIQGIPNDSLWVGTNGAGAVQYLFSDGRQVSLRNLNVAADGGLESDYIRAIALDQDYSIWFASPIGAYRYPTWAWHDIDFGGGAPIVDLAFDVHGHLWAATEESGIQVYRSPYEPPVVLHPPATLEGTTRINDLVLDRYGAIWIGTENGLDRYASDKWSSPISGSELPSVQVRTLAPDRQGLWIGTANGLAYYVFADGSVQADPFFATQSIALASVDSLGVIWIAPAAGGLWRRTPQGDWKSALPKNSGLNHTPVTALSPVQSKPGAMYAAFENAGIRYWDGEAWYVRGKNQFAGGDQVFVIAPDIAGNGILAGSMVGLLRVDDFDVAPFDAGEASPNGSVVAIAQDPTGAYWFGGQKGLSWYRSEKTPPWLLSIGPEGEGISNEKTIWKVPVNSRIEYRYTVGDLQAGDGHVQVIYRISGPGLPGDWQIGNQGRIDFVLGRVGDYTLDVVARDAALNYSKPTTYHLIAGLAPSMFDVPLLGTVPARILQLLVLFAMLAIVGFGYVSYEFGRERFRVATAVHRGFNPYISGEPVRSVEMFYGRRDMLARIVATLHNNCIMIHGERRIGKTTLLYQLLMAMRQIDDDSYWFLPVMIDLEGTTAQLFFHLLMDEIVENVRSLPQVEYCDLMLLSELQCREVAASDYTDREFGRDLRSVVGLLEEYSARYQSGKQVRLILLLDEVDTLSRFDHLYQQQLRRIFMRDFASTVGAVVAGIAINKEWDRVESPWYNMFNEIEMAPFTRTQAEELLREPVRKYYTYERSALDFILDQAGGRPYRVQQYALEAVNHMLGQKRRQITMEDVYFAHAELTAAESELKGEVTGNPANVDRIGALKHGGIVMKPVQAIK